VASGSVQHVLQNSPTYASRLPSIPGILLPWQKKLNESIDGILQSILGAYCCERIPNVSNPIPIDAASDEWSLLWGMRQECTGSCVVLAMHILHISPIEVMERLFASAGAG
jgi:hypothetical protein